MNYVAKHAINRAYQQSRNRVPKSPAGLRRGFSKTRKYQNIRLLLITFMSVVKFATNTNQTFEVRAL